MRKLLVRALRLVVPCSRLLVAVRQWLRARDSAADRHTPVVPRSQRHVFNIYEPWQPGREAFARLRVPQCVFCQQFLTEQNEEARCPWFDQ